MFACCVDPGLHRLSVPVFIVLLKSLVSDHVYLCLPSSLSCDTNTNVKRGNLIVKCHWILYLNIALVINSQRNNNLPQPSLHKWDSEVSVYWALWLQVSKNQRIWGISDSNIANEQSKERTTIHQTCRKKTYWLSQLNRFMVSVVPCILR